MITFLSVAEQLIPGYGWLDNKTKAQFKNTEPGKKFVKFINMTINTAKTLEGITDIWSTVFNAYEKEKNAIQDAYNEEKARLIQELAQTDEYKQLTNHITREILSDQYPKFALFSKAEQDELANKDITQELIKEICRLDRLISAPNTQLISANHLTPSHALYRREQLVLEKKQKKIAAWEAVLLTAPVFSTYRDTLVAQQIKELSEYFPNLNYGKPLIDGVPRQQKPVSLTDDLYNFFLQHLNTLSTIEIPFIDLTDFNQEQAHFMTAATLHAYEIQTQLDMDDLIEDYETNLLALFLQDLPVMNYHPWRKNNTHTPSILIDSLSFIWKNKVIDRGTELVHEGKKSLDKFANAHGFIQATSFSTQNENSFLAIVDLYNYIRFQDNIAENKTVLTSLLQPFMPIFDEYRDIGLYEKNVFWKYLRALIPIILTVAVIILVATILTPLELPELAFAAACIPAILVGLGVTSLYETLKNNLYKTVRESYYGGMFAIPEFQVTERMKIAFSSSRSPTPEGCKLAEKVRDFYIAELQACDKKERAYLALQAQATLTSTDKKELDTLSKKRYALALEWYDIHSNPELGVDVLPQIVIKALKKSCATDQSALELSLKAQDQAIRTQIKQATNDLKHNLTAQTRKGIVAPVPKEQLCAASPRYQPGLFKEPLYLTHKDHLEAFDKLGAEVATAKEKWEAQKAPTI